ncbi:MAG: hypothetical protein JNK82_03500, partial [Myxococcaceae bacterium]|nr:hypothetical protein [Myxococcaceae bacterium]
NLSGGTHALARLEHVTIFGNIALVGGHIRNSTGGGGTARLELLNCIIADAPALSNNAGTIVSLGGNIVADATLTAATGDLLNTVPALGTLGSNGALTRHFPLTATSVALDRIAPGRCAATDQRGVARPRGSGCEAGAVEFLDYPLIFALSPIAAGGACGAQTGIQLRVGRDDGRGGGTAGNGTLEAGEATQTSNVCDGADGANGTNGTNGTSCSVSPTSNGATLTCGATSVGITHGMNGTNGTSCSVTQTASGANISCSDGSMAAVNHGDAGSGCTVTQSPSGDATVSCADGTSAVLMSGPPGDAGAPGSACSVTQMGNAAVISCTDGTTATVRGPDAGAAGTSCGVERIDGGVQVSCGDGTSAVVSDGTDGMNGANGSSGMPGTSCTVHDNGDGTATITCPDGTMATIGEGTSPPAGGCGCGAGGPPLLGGLALALVCRRRRVTRHPLSRTGPTSR